MRTFTIIALVASLMSTVHSHGVVTQVTGANGITATDCTNRNPCQRDTSIMAQGRRARGAGPCGRTLQVGCCFRWSSSVNANGMISLVYHQVNSDGGGPVTAEVDPTGTGTSFQAVTVMQNVPGRNGRNRDTETTDHPVMVQVPATMNCTGGAAGNACIMRIRNPNTFGK
ncbi:hypothetical protein BC829DRAFT_424636 [Chytridium lagenaria]|nr:hypothetical protein BC829DRAFT_424636 [Chytridium lagenaria]